MATGREVGFGWALIAAPFAFGLLLSASGARADGMCPLGMMASRGSCCEVGREYIPSKNECMVVRPERRCLAGHLDDCVQAGKELENEGGMGANYASELYRFACEEGHAGACRRLGTMYREGKGFAKDEVRGRELYEQACSAGDAPACTQLARWMLDERTSPKADAHALLVQACHRGDGNACAVYAQELAHEPGDKAKETIYLQQACDAGVGTSCLAILDHERAARYVQPERELALLEQACKADDHGGCLALGDAYRDGLITAQSSTDAAKRYRLACDAGDVQGCMRLADLTAEGDGVRRDLHRAAQLYGQVCVNGVKAACERKLSVESEERREISHARLR